MDSTENEIHKYRITDRIIITMDKKKTKKQQHTDTLHARGGNN